MHPNEKETAVLYFTRSPGEEAKVKTFCRSGNFAQNRAIAEKLIHHTYQQVKASGLSVKVFTSDTQTGYSFGDKLANAFQSLFDEGFEKVIAVGNDCPQLSSNIIKGAADLLNDNAAVAGPASDGGVYLLGMKKAVFQIEKFSSLAWETGHLLEDFTYYARGEQFSLIQLNVLADIDTEQGLQVFLKHIYFPLLDDLLIVFLRSIYYAVSCYLSEKKIEFCHNFVQSSCCYRGPPFS